MINKQKSRHFWRDFPRSRLFVDKYFVLMILKMPAARPSDLFGEGRGIGVFIVLYGG